MIGFQIISGGIEVNKFVEILQLLEREFKDDS